LEPRLEILVRRPALPGDPNELSARLVLGDDEQALSLAVPGTRSATDGRHDPLERLLRDRLRRVVAHHAPLRQQLAELHYSSASSPSSQSPFSRSAGSSKSPSWVDSGPSSSSSSHSSSPLSSGGPPALPKPSSSQRSVIAPP